VTCFSSTLGTKRQQKAFTKGDQIRLEDQMMCQEEKGTRPKSNSEVWPGEWLCLFDFVLFEMIFIFSIIPGLQCSVNFLLHSKVTQSHIHIYILFLISSPIRFYHKRLDTGPCRTSLLIHLKCNSLICYP